MEVSGIRVWLRDTAERGATFLTRISDSVPLGSTTARVSAFTGVALGLVMHGGSVAAAADGGLFGWLSAWAGEAFQAWMAGGWAAPLVNRVAEAGAVVPGLKGSPILAGAVGCVTGAAVGLTGEKGPRGRAVKVVRHSLETGLRRLLATWAAERVVNLADDARGRRPKVLTALKQWTPGQIVRDVVLEGEKLPPGKLVEDEDAYCRKRMSEAQLTQLKRVVSGADEALQRLCAMAGVAYDNDRAHRVWLTSNSAVYNRIDPGTLARHSLDLNAESFVRMGLEPLLENTSTPELQLALLTERISAELTRIRIRGDEKLVVEGGFRVKTLAPKDAVDARDSSEKVARDFDNAVNAFLAHVALDLRPRWDKHDARVVKLWNLRAALPAERRDTFVAALVQGRLQCSLEPVCEFFAPGAVPAVGTTERAELEQRILTLSDEPGPASA